MEKLVLCYFKCPLTNLQCQTQCAKQYDCNSRKLCDCSAVFAYIEPSDKDLKSNIIQQAFYRNLKEVLKKQGGILIQAGTISPNENINLKNIIAHTCKTTLKITLDVDNQCQINPITPAEKELSLYIKCKSICCNVLDEERKLIFPRLISIPVDYISAGAFNQQINDMATFDIRME